MTDKTGTRSSISAFVVCCNEEDNMRRCLESVRWCDEIIVIDSGSTDKTVELCREFTDKVFHNSWPGFVAQKRLALEKCTSDWVLNIDADEEVSPELRDEILQVLKDYYHQEVPPVLGFSLSRVVFYFGKWWRKGGWYPEYRLRLCYRTATSWGGSDPHEKAIVDGNTARLKGELRHYTYTDLADQARSINSLSSSAARTLHKKGAKVTISGIILRSFARFIKFYFFKYGFKEGAPGLVVALMESWSVFLKYAKLWELRRSERSSQINKQLQNQ